MVTKPTKYTKEFVTAELKDMLEQIRNNPDIILLGQVIENKDYSLQRFSEWRKKFEGDKEISETIGKIKGILETRLNFGGIKGDFNATMTKLNLINNYGWVDKVDTELSGKVEIPPVTVVFVDNENDRDQG
jgi:hypothetical protein